MTGSFKIWVRQFAEDCNGFVRRIFRRWIKKIVEIAVSDLDLMQSFRDLTSSAAFANEHFRNVPVFKDRDLLFRWTLGQVGGDNGLFLEFGVYKGASINRLAGLRPSATFYGFDTFTGLPEAWTLGAKKRAFDVGGWLPPVRKNVRLIKGLFEDTLKSFVAEHHASKISFMHVDCDLYSATRTILRETRGLLMAGTIIVFDELINYPDWQNGEYKAFMEFTSETGVSYEFIGYVRGGSQVAVKIL